jgi:20S proteasome alpha/beta subunit
MKISTVVLVAAVVIALSASASVPTNAQALSNGDVLGGTLNVALANKNGAVVLTDSMLSDESGPVPIPHPETPGQKLFQLDDKTICAIAGFVSVPGLFPEFSPSVSAVVNHFSEELKRNPPQLLRVKLTALGMLMGQNISAIAALRTAANKPLRAKNYRSTITLVGYDTDDNLKIGQVQLEADPEHMERGAVVTKVEIVSVGDGLTPRLAGKWEIANKLLNDPASKPNDETLTRLKVSLASDGGASLTLNEMRGIAKSLVSYTAQADCTVGGDNQIAELTQGRATIVEQRQFSAPQETLVRFSLLVGEQIEAAKTPGQKPPSTPAEIKPTAVEVAPGSSGLFVQADFARVRQQLDGAYFYLSKFDHCVISYKGGPFYFDDNNETKDSYLYLYPSVDTKDPKVKSLIQNHRWLQVIH